MLLPDEGRAGVTMGLPYRYRRIRVSGKEQARVPSGNEARRQKHILKSSSILKPLHRSHFLILFEGNGMKIILWIIAIIFIVGLLTLTGVFKILF